MKENVSKEETQCTVSSKKAISEHWRDEKKYYLSHEKSITSPKENVMERFYGISNNKYKPILLKEITLDRIIHKYGAHGFVYISTVKDDIPEINDSNIRKLIQDIRNSGYSYLPTYTGDKNTEAGVSADYEFEPSFIVFNHIHNGEHVEFSSFHSFVSSLCDKYAQHFVMNKYPCPELIRYGISVNPLPICLCEEQIRRGEIMIWRV